MIHKSITLLVVFIIGIAGISLIIKKDSKAKPARIIAGMKAPDFNLQDTTGKMWKLSDLKGKVIFLNFWASWCDTCKEEKPLIQQLANSMQDKQIVFLTVLYKDTPQDAEKYMKYASLSLPVLIDSSGVAMEYGLTGVPETVIIDKQGNIVDKFIGPKNWLSPEAAAFITSLINQ